MAVRLKTEGWVVFGIATTIYTVCIPFVTLFALFKEIFYIPLGIIRGYKTIWDEVSKRYWY